MGQTYYNLSPINQCLALKSYFQFIFKKLFSFFLSRICANDKWHKKHLVKPNEASKQYIYLNLCEKNKVKAKQNIQTYSCVWSFWQEDIFFPEGFLANLRQSIVFLPYFFFFFFHDIIKKKPTWKICSRKITMTPKCDSISVKLKKPCWFLGDIVFFVAVLGKINVLSG